MPAEIGEVKDKFLTKILGIESYRVEWPGLFWYTSINNKTAPCFEYVRFSLGDVKSYNRINLYCKAGFKKICEEVEFVKDISRFEYVEQNRNYTVHDCFVADQEYADNIINRFATTFTNDRFRQDVNTRDKAFAIKRQWIKNTFDRKRGSILFFALNDRKEPVGFVSAVRRSYKWYRIDLISVLEEYRNQGIAKKLIDVLSMCSNIDLLSACTQANNEAAVKMYKRLGFEINQVYTVLHRMTRG